MQDLVRIFTAGNAEARSPVAELVAIGTDGAPVVVDSAELHITERPLDVLTRLDDWFTGWRQDGPMRCVARGRFETPVARASQ